MVGNMIYLLFRQDLRRGGIILIAPHATFDGVEEQLHEELDNFRECGWFVTPQRDGAYLVTEDTEDNPSKFYYFVSSRTIEK